jgi:hypothetical protein
MECATVCVKLKSWSSYRNIKQKDNIVITKYWVRAVMISNSQIKCSLSISKNTSCVFLRGHGTEGTHFVKLITSGHFLLGEL